MKTPNEFKEETLRRAQALRRRDSRRRRMLVTYLSTAACFVLIVGVMLGIGPILSGTMAEDAFPNHDTPASTPQYQDNHSIHTTGDPVTSRVDPNSQAGKSDPVPSAPVATTNPMATVCDSSTVAPAPTPKFEMRILNHTPPIHSDSSLCLLLDSYDSYRLSPYFAEGSITEADFEGSTVYLILCPAPVGRVDITITTQQGETHNVTLFATTYTDEGGYCAKFLVCTEPFAAIDFGIYIT